MGLCIRNREVERFADQVAAMAGETKTEAIRKALDERKEQLMLRSRRGGKKLHDIHPWLEADVWPKVPPRPGARAWAKKQRKRSSVSHRAASDGRLHCG
jgi:antitoxin VapB